MATKRLLKNATLDSKLDGISIADIKSEYVKLKTKYDKLQNGYYCHWCDKFQSAEKFYMSKKWKSGVVPTCKDCLIKIATNFDPKTKKSNEDEEGIKKALKLCDLPFIREVYVASVDAVKNVNAEKTRTTVFQQMVVMMQTLKQYVNKSWEDSDPEEFVAEQNEKKIAKSKRDAAMKRFGSGFSDSDYEFLENEYQDWTARYTCENKAQEVLFIRICCKELELHKAQMNGEDTKDLDKSLQDLMSSLNIRPSQKNASAMTENKTFGQLIDIWEQEKPIPEPEDEFKDVDKIGTYLTVFFKGHLAKMMNFKNAFSRIYDKYIAKYSVERNVYNEDSSSEEIFEQLFGTVGEDDV